MLFLLFLLILNITIFLNLKYISGKIRIYDLPDNNRKIHNFRVTKIGGVILFVNIILIIIYLDKFKFSQNFNSFFFIVLLTFIISLIDDLKDIKPIYRLISFYFVFFIWVIIDTNMQINNLEFITYSIDFSFFLFK